MYFIDFREQGGRPDLISSGCRSRFGGTGKARSDFERHSNDFRQKGQGGSDDPISYGFQSMFGGKGREGQTI